MLIFTEAPMIFFNRNPSHSHVHGSASTNVPLTATFHDFEARENEDETLLDFQRIAVSGEETSGVRQLKSSYQIQLFSIMTDLVIF